MRSTSLFQVFFCIGWAGRKHSGLAFLLEFSGVEYGLKLPFCAPLHCFLQAEVASLKPESVHRVQDGLA